MTRGVYFIQAGSGGPIKIGWAANAHRRLRTLQTAHHEDLRLLATIPAHETLETFLHGRFSDGLVRGEWFDPETPGLFDLIAMAQRGTAPDWALAHVRPHVQTIEDAFDGLPNAAPVRHGDANA